MVAEDGGSAVDGLGLGFVGLIPFLKNKSQQISSIISCLQNGGDASLSVDIICCYARPNVHAHHVLARRVDERPLTILSEVADNSNTPYKNKCAWHHAG